MHLVTERLHIRENGGVGQDAMKGPTASALPAIIDVHIGPAVVDKATTCHSFGIRLDQVLRDLRSIDIPAVPTHRRRQRDLFPDDEAEGSIGMSGAVTDMKEKGVLARGIDRSGKAAGGLIEMDACRQRIGGEPQGPDAGRGDGENDGMAGPDAENPGAVDAWSGSGGGGQNDSRVVGR